MRALEAALDRGPAAQGWVDERWTLARIRELIIGMFGVEYTVAGVWLLLDRRGWSCQVPVRRAVERDEGAVVVWRKEVWGRARK
ncbi:winged helix-turn-helix domain-containing protein [Frankia sp. Ag45/Mut15]|uniref:Winged helix-turn-helix domain-containing protein n=1 Tax=Frankia umida TaxID=573489 RepID=A0ABT0K4X7_9ACTN|nr:winged helix-turn-helix domain-containing protein [Frankia umida]MCK9878854.1 winged helix-turn-helix domain-containing protein [Frankia umida]